MPWNASWTPYDYPNVTNIYEAFEYVNSVTSDMFAAGMLLSVFVVLLVVFKRYGIDVSFTTSSFITMGLAGILRAAALISDPLFMTFAVLTGVGALIMWLGR